MGVLAAPAPQRANSVSKPIFVPRETLHPTNQPISCPGSDVIRFPPLKRLGVEGVFRGCFGR